MSKSKNKGPNVKEKLFCKGKHNTIQYNVKCYVEFSKKINDVYFSSYQKTLNMISLSNKYKSYYETPTGGDDVCHIAIWMGL